MSRPDFDQARFIAALTRHQPALAAFCHAQLANRQDAQVKGGIDAWSREVNDAVPRY